MIFRPNTETHWYWIFVDMDEDSTRVAVQRNPNSISVQDRADMVDETYTQILNIKPAMQGVNPQNMHDKLKLLLIYS